MKALGGVQRPTGELPTPGRREENLRPGQTYSAPTRASIHPRTDPVESNDRLGRGLGITAASTLDSLVTWPSAVSSSGTTRPGRTTSQPLPAWRCSPTSPLPPRSLSWASGCFPSTGHQPVRIAAEIARLGLDPAKLWIGVGSGQLRRANPSVQRAVAELRSSFRRGRASSSRPCDHRCAISAAPSPTASCSTGCCPPAARRAAGCSKEPTRRDAPP